MELKTALTRKDIITAAICIIFLFLNLGMIGAGGRQRAKEAVCQSNLRQWGLMFGMYLDDHDGKFSSGSHLGGVYDPGQPEIWTNAMAGYYPKDNYNFFCCPVASRPGVDADGNVTPGLSAAQRAWGLLPDSDWFIEGMYGSYGMNWYAYNAKKDMRIHRYNTNDYWGHPNYENASEIPLFFDSAWINVGPFDDDRPPEFEGQMPDEWPGDEMRRVCLDRHNGAINMLFMDFSVRKVGLKQLWKLKWHKRFDTDAPAPGRGWPTWMQDLKDY